MRRFALATALGVSATAVIVQAAVDAVRITDWKVLWTYEIRPWVEWDGKDAPPAIGEGWTVAWSFSANDFQPRQSAEAESLIQPFFNKLPAESLRPSKLPAGPVPLGAWSALREDGLIVSQTADLKEVCS